MKKLLIHIPLASIDEPINTIAIQTKKKKKASCCEKFKKKGKGFCKSCPNNWA